MRRAVVIFKKYGGQEIMHDQLVSMVYQILTEGNPVLAAALHAPQKFKPFTFAKEDIAENLTLYFSSVNKEVTNAFMSGARSLIGSGILAGSTICKAIDVVGLPDVRLFNNSIRVRTISPVTVSRNENGRKMYISYSESNPQEWVGALKKNLVKRMSAFCGNDGDTGLKLRVMENGRYSPVLYQGVKIPAKHVVLKLTGDPKTLETALYGGIGERTGSGFGMMLPC